MLFRSSVTWILRTRKFASSVLLYILHTNMTQNVINNTQCIYIHIYRHIYICIHTNTQLHSCQISVSNWSSNRDTMRFTQLRIPTTMYVTHALQIMWKRCGRVCGSTVAERVEAFRLVIANSCPSLHDTVEFFHNSLQFYCYALQNS